MLTRIHDFNLSMNNAANPAQTAKSGEALNSVSVINPHPQQIPLSINNPAVQPMNPSEDCCNCGCGSCCCECCLIKPASYTDGLYRIDYKIYNISFLIFSVFTIYPESTLYALSESYHGLFLPTTGLIFFIIASSFMLCAKDNKSPNSVNCVRGSLFIFGGLFYFLGFMIHSFNISDVCEDEDYWDYYDCGEWGFDDVTPEPEYLIGRGMFVGFHAIFLGLLYVANHKFKRCFHSRIRLIRFWSFLFFIFSLFVLCWIIYPWYFLAYMGFSPMLLQLVSLLNCFLMKKSNEMGGCGSGTVLGLIMTIGYYFSMLFLTIFIAEKSFVHGDEQGWYLFWDLSLLFFGAMQLWILGRAMSPVTANCGCVMDGNGDGNVGGNHLRPQQPVVVIVPQQQPQQVGMVPVVTTAAMPNVNASEIAPMQMNDDDEGDML